MDTRAYEILTAIEQAFIEDKGTLPKEEVIARAVERVLHRACCKKTGYALAQTMLLTALAMPQEWRPQFVNRLTAQMMPSPEEGGQKTWASMRAKVHYQVIKAASITQALAALFEDWPVQLEVPGVQLTFFGASSVDTATGEVRED